MKPTTSIWLIATAALWLAGCTKPAGEIQPKGTPAPTSPASHLLAAQVGGKLFVNPVEMDSLQWDVDVTFRGKSPCSTLAVSANTQCQVASGTAGAFYLYTCADCGDPGLIIRSSTHDPTLAKKGSPKAHFAGDTETVAVYCDGGNNAAIDPAQLDIGASSKNKKKLSYIQWFLVGVAKADLVMGAPSFCSSFDSSVNLCTVDPKAPQETSLPYAVTAGSCTGSTKASGSVIVH